MALVHDDDLIYIEGSVCNFSMNSIPSLTVLLF